jgi:PAS domain S-box-containing protein
MNPEESSLAVDANEEIPALIETLLATEQRLEELTAGEVDTVTGRDGRTFMLRHAREQLRLREAARQAALLNELRVLFDMVPAMIWFKDTENGFLRVNKQGAAATGRLVEEIEGKSAYEIFPEEAAGYYADDLEVIHSGAPKMGIVEKLRGPKGQELWVQTDKVPVLDKDGKVIGLVVMAQDISERKRDEESLRASQANMAAAQRIAHFGSWELELTNSKDVDSNALRWSDEMYRIAGYAPGAVEVSNELFFNLVHPEDRESIRQAVETAIRERREYSIVHRLIRADGETRVVQETAQIFFDETTGHPAKIVGTAHDITEQRKAEEELRESEERFASAFEHAPNGVALVSPEGRWLKTNQAIRDLFGYTEEELKTRTIVDLTHPDDIERSWEHVRSAIAGDFRSLQIEKRYIHKRGNVISALLNISLIRDARGQPHHFVTQIQDITERKSSQRVIERGLLRLNEAQRIGQIGDWEWDIATQAITWSPQVFEIVGRDPSLGPPRDYEESAAIYDVASRTLMAEKVNRAIESGEAQKYELLALRPGGKQVYVQAMAVPSKDERGRVVGLHGTIQDITERKEAEAALKESESRYHSLFENMVEGYAYCRTQFEQDQLRDFTYVEVNGAFERLTGLKDVVGKKVSEVIPGVYEASPELFAVYGRVALTGKPERFETELKSLGIWFSVTVYSRERGHFVAVFDNITERKRAETALRLSESEFRALAEAMPQMVWITRPDGWNIYFSQQWMDYTGLTLEESLGHGWNKPFHPDDQQQAWDAWRHAVATTGIYSVECRLRRADGVYRWWLVRGVPQKDTHGNILKWFGTCTDIHDLKLAEESLRLLGSGVEQAKESIVITDAELDLPGPRIVFVNPAFTTMTGYSAEEVIGKTPRMFQGPDTDRTVLNRLRKDLERGEAFHGEVINYRKDGTEFNLEWQITPIRNASRTITNFVAIQRDITERKRAQAHLERLADMIDASPDFIGFADPKTAQLKYVNKHGRRMCGIGEDEDIGKLKISDVHPAWMNKLFAEVIMPAAVRDGLWEGEGAFLHRDGREIPVSMVLLARKAANGEVDIFYTVSRDITERKRSEAELKKAHKKLVETSRRAGMAEVATGILHNVGNVLNSVNVASSCIADSIRTSKAANLSKVVDLFREHESDLSAFLTHHPQGKQIPGYLAQLADHLSGEQAAALTELARLQKHIEHIKDIVSMQQSFAKASGLIETLQLTNLVEDALRMNSSSFTHRDIQVIKEFENIAPVAVEKHKVLQILVNLVRNAQQACTESGRPDGRLTLRVTRGSNQIRIAVSDNGIGIPAENLTRIFNHGFTTKKDGHGFGLHSSALAAKEMGGSLHVKSAGPGQGATFNLELPLRHPKSAID